MRKNKTDLDYINHMIRFGERAIRNFEEFERYGSQGFEEDFIIDGIAKSLNEFGEQLAKNKLSRSIYLKYEYEEYWYNVRQWRNKSTHAYETQDAIEVIETVKEELPEWLNYVYQMKDDLILEQENNLEQEESDFILPNDELEL